MVARDRVGEGLRDDFRAPLATSRDARFRVASENPPLLKPRSIRFDWRQDGSIATLVICVITGSSGVYYAFFACFLILVAGLATTAAQRRWAPLLSALIMLSVTAAVVLVCLSPHLFLGHHEISGRVSGDAETYALKISQLLLPVSGHRLPALAALKKDGKWKPGGEITVTFVVLPPSREPLPADTKVVFREVVLPEPRK